METSNEELIESLVADCLEALDQDETCSIDAVLDRVAGDRHTVRDALQKRLVRLRELGLLAQDDDRASQPRIPGYVLRSCLGAGGMGEVWLATQTEPIHRAVAVKVIRSDRRNDRAVQRFLTERQALAKMSHPGIAQVYDAGQTDSGEPYFAMEFVDGRPITDVHRERDLDLRSTLELIARICDAVQHAHARGVLHRDLKPHNILVTEVDGELRPKVIDFGLAKGLESAISDDAHQTLDGQVLGTPHYMAPEQADPDVDDIDVRVDVYGLGAVLFELVTGTLPIEIPKATLFEVVQTVRHAERPAPSTRLRERASSDDGSDPQRQALRSLASRCRGDLDRILKRALQIDPELRYPTVAALGADLRAFLEDRPISATPPTTIYRLRKFAKRRRGTFLTAVAILLTAMTGLGFALHYQVQNRESLAMFDSVADQKRLDRLIQEAEVLGPLLPSGLDQLQDWLGRADAALEKRSETRRSLEETRAKATDPKAEDPLARGYDRGRFVVLDESLTQKLEDLERLARRHEEVSRWTSFARSVPPPTDPELAARWQDAIATIRDTETCPAYGGLEITPQEGLAPLRRNPRTGLFEFAVIWPGLDAGLMAEPESTEDGSVTPSESTAPVVVLIPGGSFVMGSEVREEAAAYDRFASNDEDPRHPVRLDPYFIGKYELTQAQWRALTTTNPSLVTSDFEKRIPGARLRDPIDERHPVEQVSWEDATRWLRRLGLELPTEAQWERAARAGTDTPWWTGALRRSVVDPIAANLSDESAAAQGIYTSFEPGLDDGYIYHGPVDLGVANPFGLHGTIGNVWEWVQDRYHFYDAVRPAPGNGLRSAEGDDDRDSELPRVVRGGGFDAPAIKARHAQRLSKGQSDRSAGIGLRICRPLRDATGL